MPPFKLRAKVVICPYRFVLFTGVMIMNCPVCKNAMITMELWDVEIDYCAGCKGIWLDRGELELLLGDGGKSKELLSSFAASPQSTEIPKRCPICDKKMEKINAGKENTAVLLDRCIKGDGL